MRTLISFCLFAAVAPCIAGNNKPVLWRPPGNITVTDWVWGPGGEAHAPKPPFQFLGEDFSGTNPKIKVRDANGERWTVKFGGENHGDVFAARLVFAMGYSAQPSYFVRSGVIGGVHGLKRAKPFIGKHGEFAYARFKLHSQNFTRVENMGWSWTNNPFVGTHELNGLKILMMLASNWDAKDSRDGKGSNTAVYAGEGSHGDEIDYYAFDDWGATFGKWGGFFSRDKWDADGYSGESRSFASTQDGQTVHWGYRGKHGRDITAGVGVDDVRWLLTYLDGVTDEDLRAGLRASGATPADAGAYATAIRERISQVQGLCSSAKPAR